MNLTGRQNNPRATRLEMFCRGFTLIELLVVVAIIAVLAVFSVGGFQKATSSAKESKCVAKMRAIGVAFGLYQADRGRYPKAAEYTTGFTGGTFWFTDIYPYLSEGQSFKVVDDKFDTPLRCPSETTRGWPYIDYGLNCYALPLGIDDIPTTKIDIPSRTFLVAESKNWCIAGWYGSLAQEVEFRHNKSANFLMFDGHVEKITKNQLADPNLVKSLKGSK